MVDIRQTVQYANYLEKIGWVVEKSGEINYFIKKLPLVGSIIKVQRPEEIRINIMRFKLLSNPRRNLTRNIFHLWALD